MFKNVNIAKKLIVSFIAVALVSSIAGLVGLLLLKNTDTNYGIALVENGFVQGDIGKYNSYLNKGAGLVRDIIMLTDETEFKKAQAEFETTKALALEALSATKVNCKTPAELAIVAKIDAALPKYQQARDQAIQLGLQNKNDEALALFRAEARPYLNECILAGEELMDLNVKLGKDVSKSLSSQAVFGMLLMLIIIIISSIVAVVVAWITARSIAAPVKACSKRLQLLSEGDLHSDIPPATSNDEVGIMLNSLKTTTEFLNSIIKDIGYELGQMASGNLNVDFTFEYQGDFVELKHSMITIVSSLNDALTQINQASDEVSSGSDQVSSSAQALSQGTTEQASSVEELAATITEISERVQSNADNSIHAKKMSKQAEVEVVASNEKMQELIVAMNEISKTSQNIGNVIKTIENIAFQTDILALNAAVEAARAGVAGKGFAVVADEVRNLASKSAEAAKSTTQLIEGAVQAVANGTALADDTAKSLDTVVTGAKEISIVIDKISSASSEQAISIAQVTQGIDQISSVIQTNSATAEESAAASEELSGQAAMLKGLVNKFTLKDTRNSIYTPQYTADEIQIEPSYDTPASFAYSSSKY